MEVLRHITPGVFFTVEDPEYRDSSYHEQCTHDCLKVRGGGGVLARRAGLDIWRVGF